MKAELVKDLALTCIVMITDIMYMPLPIFLPYIYSYLKINDIYITFSYCYCIAIFIYIGSFFANIVLPNCFVIFGIKKTFMIGALIYFLNSVFFALYHDRYSLILYGIIGGVSFNFKTLPTNYYLCSKYKDGVKYLPYCYIGQSIGVLVWSYFMIKIINPLNGNLDAVTYANGFEERYYQSDVAENCGNFIVFNGFISLVVISLCAFFLNEPHYLKGNFILWINYYFRNNKSAKKILDKRFQRMNLSRSIVSEQNSISLNTSTMSKKSSNSYERNEKKTKKLEKEISKEIWSAKFIGFIIITTIKNTPSALLIDCYKIIALKIIKDDQLSSIIYCFVTFADIFGRFFVPIAWEKYGFYKVYLGNFFCDIFYEVLFIIYGCYNIYGFVITIIIAGLLWAFGYLLGHTTIFGLYRPIKAVGVSKAFDTYYFFQSALAVYLTYIFVDKGEYRMCFVVCVILETLAALAFYFFYESFGDLNKDGGLLEDEVEQSENELELIREIEMEKI